MGTELHRVVSRKFLMIIFLLHPTYASFKTPNGKWVRVKRWWGIYILSGGDLFVFLTEKYFEWRTRTHFTVRGLVHLQN